MEMTLVFKNTKEHIIEAHVYTAPINAMSFFIHAHRDEMIDVTVPAENTKYPWEKMP